MRKSDADARRGLRFRRPLTALLVVVLTSAVLTACGASGARQTASSRAALLTTLQNWSALQTPVDQALGVLTQQCMAQHGYRYYPYPQNGQPGGPQFFSTPLFGSSLWLGPQSLAWRLVNGWGLYEETMQQLSQPNSDNGLAQQEQQVMRSLRGRAFMTYIKALYGGGKAMKIRIPGLPHMSLRIGGCNTTAGTKLFGSVAASVAIPMYGSSILGTVQSSAAHTPALHASQASWVACVHAHTKLTVRSPSQLFLHFYSLYESKGPTPAVHRQELAAAVADLRCQRQARLPQTVRTAALSAIGHLSPSVVGEIGTLLSALQQARSRAQALFAHPTTSLAVTTKGSATPQPAAAGGPNNRPGSVVVLGG